MEYTNPYLFFIYSDETNVNVECFCIFLMRCRYRHRSLLRLGLKHCRNSPYAFKPLCEGLVPLGGLHVVVHLQPKVTISKTGEYKRAANGKASGW